MCCLGGTINRIKIMVETLSTMKHHIQTAFGNSKKGQNYKDWEAAIARNGQGNWALPQIWAAVSTVLFNVCDERRWFLCQPSMCNVTDWAETSQICLCGWYQSMPNPRARACNHHNKRMQNAVNHWARILRASGGGLVLEKCFWYAIDFKWHNNKWH